MPKNAKFPPMDVPATRSWTQAEFLSWAETQDTRYEFDGVQPVAMTGGSLVHSAIGSNIQTALRNRLRGAPCQPVGPDAGVKTIFPKIRFPDAVVTCTKIKPGALLVEDPIIVFEVLSPTSGRTDRILKVLEYRAVPSVLQYIILESLSIGITVLTRSSTEEPWISTVLTETDILTLPKIGIEIPVSEFYLDIDLTDTEEAAS